MRAQQAECGRGGGRSAGIGPVAANRNPADRITANVRQCRGEDPKDAVDKGPQSADVSVFFRPPRSFITRNDKEDCGQYAPNDLIWTAG